MRQGVSSAGFRTNPIGLVPIGEYAGELARLPYLVLLPLPVSRRAGKGRGEGDLGPSTKTGVTWVKFSLSGKNGGAWVRFPPSDKKQGAPGLGSRPPTKNRG